MRVHLRVSTIVAGFVFALSSASAQEVTELSAIDSCGTSFLELPGSQPGAMKWESYCEEFHDYMGVPAYSNGGYTTSKCYQCTEVIPRFLKQVYGFEASYCSGYGNGNRTAAGIARTFEGVVASSAIIAPYQVRLQYMENGKSSCRPTIGSVISFELGKNGHVAIVRDLKEKDDGSIEVTLFAQHGRMYNQVGSAIRPDKAFLRKDTHGNWVGTYIAPTQKKYSVIGWTNPVIAGQAANPEAYQSIKEPSMCSSITADRLPDGQSICSAIQAAKAPN